jgi:peroxiredoxin
MKVINKLKAIKNKSVVRGFCLLYCTICLNCEVQSENQVNLDTSSVNRLELTGIIPGLKEGEVVYLKKWDVGKHFPVLLDSVEVQKGKFFFQYFINDGPRLFWIQFSKHNQIIPVALNNEKVLITYDKDIDSIEDQNAFKYVKVDGSETARQYLYSNLALYFQWVFGIKKIDAEIRKVTDYINSKENLIFISGLLKAKELMNLNISQIFSSQPVKEAIPILFDNIPLQFQRDNLFIGAYSKFDDRLKNSYYGKLMKECLPLCNGQNAPEFTFEADNKSYLMTEVVKKNKLTILHFWSNTSVDRKRIHAELSSAYNKYRTKGLEVVSVSLDANQEKWRKVIQEDNLPGYQICDFKEEESPIAKLYKIDPKWTVNILIDQNGKMIAWDVDGPALFGYLFKIMGE